jgi:uncharacterized protein with HEPN domain
MKLNNKQNIEKYERINDILIWDIASNEINKLRNDLQKLDLA